MSMRQVGDPSVEATSHLRRTELMTPDTEMLKVTAGVGASPRGLVTCVLHNKAICCPAISETESCGDGIVDFKVKDPIPATILEGDCCQ